MKPEDSLHITIADWLRVKYPDLLWWHTGNGGSRNVIEATKLKRMGVKAGVPDIFIPKVKPARYFVVPDHIKGLEEMWKNPLASPGPLLINDVKSAPDPIMRPGYFGFFCELKAGKNKPTKTQTEMMQKLTELGYYCCVCYSLDEFIKEWEQYNGA